MCIYSGAGKSSLMLTLFRIVEPECGSVVLLDDIDVLQVGLDVLRSQLTIIPQDPVMFSGTFGVQPIHELWIIMCMCVTRIIEV